MMQPDTFFRELLQRFIHAGKDRMAFSTYDGEKTEEISYLQLVKDILNAAAYFKENGIFQQHIALLGLNNYAWCVGYYAVEISGNMAIPLNQDLQTELLQEQLEDADVAFAFADPQTKEYLQKDHPDVQWVSYEIFSARTPMLLEEVYCPADANETAMMLSTSGTTGKSKFVELTYQNLRYASIIAEEDFPEYKNYLRRMAVYPFHHAAGLSVYLLMLTLLQTACLTRGSRYFFQDMKILKPSVLSAVPSMLNTLRKLVGQAGEESENIFKTELKGVAFGGAKLSPDFCRSFLEKGVVLASFYGMTETTATGTYFEMDEQHCASIGHVRSCLQARIEDGEILLKGPTIMKGYYKDPEETAKVLDADGWLHTGDLGYCDADGYYYITGRKKNVIILANGENVNPEEVEETFSRCPAIAESLVYSDGKGICADVYSMDRIAAEQFIAAYNENVPTYRQVYKVNFTQTPLEKTGSGKIKRKVNV